MENNVLIVDDSKLIVKRLSQLISEELKCINYVGAAGSYTEAISQLDLHDFSIAILDINLPGKNGIELLTYIKQNYPSIKTIMLTNQSDDHYRDLCMKIGTDNYVDKTDGFDTIPVLLNGYFQATM